MIGCVKGMAPTCTENCGGAEVMWRMEVVKKDPFKKMGAGPGFGWTRSWWNHLAENTDAERVSLMQRNGVQRTLLTDEAVDVLEDTLRGKLLSLRRRNRGRARDVTFLLSNFVRRGLRGRMPALRQISFSSSYEFVINELWPSVARAIKLHTNSNGEWIESFWRRARSECRRAWRNHRRQEARGQVVPRNQEEGDQMDVDEGPGLDSQDNFDFSTILILQLTLMAMRKQYPCAITNYENKMLGYLDLLMQRLYTIGDYPSSMKNGRQFSRDKNDVGMEGRRKHNARVKTSRSYLQREKVE